MDDTNAGPAPSTDWGITKTFDNTPLPQSPIPPGEGAVPPADGPPEPPPPDMPTDAASNLPVETPEPAPTTPAQVQISVPAPTPTPGPVIAEETVMIPPSPTPVNNPFIPQDSTPTEPQPVKKSSGFKRVIMFLLILLLLVGLGAGAYFALGYVNTSKQANLIYWGLWEDNPAMGKILTDFQTKNPTIKVQYVKQSPKQYRERLQAAIARGDGPDVFEFHNTWVPMLRNELLPAPATIVTTQEFASTFYPVASADLVGGSSVYGMPMMFDGLGLYYNVDLLTSAGVSPPTTWPELLDMVPKLTVRTDTQIQQSAIALGSTGNIEHFSDIIALMMMQNGAKLISPIGKEAEDTLMFYRKFTNPSDIAYTWNDAMDNSVYAFATGRVAMILAPSWRVFEIKQINPSLNFKIAPVPQLPGSTVNWASYWAEGASTKSKFPKESWTLIKYLTGHDAVVTLYSEASKVRLFGQPYGRTDLASTLQSDPYVGAYISEAPTAKSFPLASRTYDNGINDRLIKYMEDAVNAVAAGSAPSQALATAAQGFAQILGSFGLSAPPAAPTP